MFFGFAYSLVYNYQNISCKSYSLRLAFLLGVSLYKRAAITFVSNSRSFIKRRAIRCKSSASSAPLYLPVGFPLLSLTRAQCKVAAYSISSFVILTKEESLLVAPALESFPCSAKFSTFRMCFSVSN